MNRNKEQANVNAISIVENAIESNNTLSKTELKWILDLLVDYLEVKKSLRSFKVSQNTNPVRADELLADIYHRTLIEQYPFE